MAGFNVQPNVGLRGINPQGFVSQTPEAPQINMFAAAAQALTAGLVTGEAEMRRRQEQDRAFALTAKNYEQTQREFAMRHEMAIKEADALAQHRASALELQNRAFDLDQKKWDVEKEALEFGMERESFMLDETRRQVQKSRDSDRTLNELFEEISRTQSADDVLITTFADYRDDAGNLIARDAIDNSQSAFGLGDTSRMAGVSVNQKSIEAAFPGLPKSEQAKIQVEVFQDGKALGTLPLVDRGPANWVLQKNGRQVLDITPKGIKQLGGDIVTSNGKVVDHTLKGGRFSFKLKGPGGDNIEPTLPEGYSMSPNLGDNASVVQFSLTDRPNSLFPPTAEEETAAIGQLSAPNPYIAQYEKLKLGLVNPAIDDEGRQKIALHMELLGRDPEVRSALNKDEAEKFAAVYAVPAPIRKNFIEQASNAPVRMTDETREVMYKSLLDQHNAGIKAADTGYFEKTAGERETLRRIGEAFGTLNRFRKKMSELDPKEVGRIQGQISKVFNKLIENPSVSEAQQIIEAALPEFARGIFGEVGVLSDVDIRRYRSTLPSLTDSPELAETLVKNLEDILYSKISSQVLQEKFEGYNYKASINYFESLGIPPERYLGDKEAEIIGAERFMDQIRNEVDSGSMPTLSSGFSLQLNDGKYQVLDPDGIVVITADTWEEMIEEYNK